MSWNHLLHSTPLHYSPLFISCSSPVTDQSKSIGSMVGLNSVDLEDRMASLKDSQEKAIQLTEEVNKKAQEMVEKVGDPNERQQTIQEPRDLLEGVLDMTDIKVQGNSA